MRPKTGYLRRERFEPGGFFSYGSASRSRRAKKKPGRWLSVRASRGISNGFNSYLVCTIARQYFLLLLRSMMLDAIRIETQALHFISGVLIIVGVNRVI